MADENEENLPHDESDGTQWEIGNAKLSTSKNKLYNLNNKRIDAWLADDYTHHPWQELSNKKEIRNIDEAKKFIEYDVKNASAWSNLGIANVLNGSDDVKKRLYDDIGASADGKLEKPISTLSLIKAAANYVYDDSKIANNNAKAAQKSAEKNHEGYEEYLSKYERTADFYKPENASEDFVYVHTVKFASSADDAQATIDKYKEYDPSVGWNAGGLSVTAMDGCYSVTIDANLEATIYNKTEAIRLAKEEAKREENKKLLDAKSAAKQAKKDKAAEKQRLAVRLKNYKDVAADNDRIRTSKAKIEEVRYNDELAIAAQEEKDKKLIEEAKARNAKAADDWAKKFKKANPNATPEEVEAAKQDYIKVENAKSEHEINDATERKKLAASIRSTEMDMTIEAATPVADTSELYAEQQQQATDAKKAKKKFSLGDAKSLASKGMGYLNDAKNGNLLNKLTGKFAKGGSLGLNKLINSMSKNNPKLMSALSKFGLRNGLLDNILGNALKAGIAYGDSLLKSAIDAGMSWAFNHLAEKGFDEYVKNTVYGLVYAGGDPNYNGTFLRIILEADYPICLAYLDEFNGIDKNAAYTLEMPESKRGMIAAKNGAHLVAKYVCDKLYKSYKTYSADGSATAQKDKAEAIANEIRKIFNATVTYSYSNFAVKDLKTWLASEAEGGFAEILTPAMLGFDDPTCFGKYKITDLNIIAPIVKISSYDGDKSAGIASFDSAKGMRLNGAGSKGKVDSTNLTKVEEYIDLRNSNFKKIYCQLVSDEYSEPDRLTNKPLYERLSKYKVLDALTKAMSKMVEAMNKSDTTKDLAHIVNNMVRATIHNTLSLMDKYNLILKAKDSKGGNVFDVDNSTPPEFVDYSHSDITFKGNGGKTSDNLETYKQSDVVNGKETGLTSNKFKKDGFVFAGWAESAINDTDVTDSSVKYKNSSKIKINDDLTLYAVWKVKESSSGGKDDETQDDDDEKQNDDTPPITNTKTKDDLDKESDEIISKNVKIPAAFTKAGITLNDITSYDINGMTDDTQASKIASLSAAGFTVLFNSKELIKFNGSTNTYDNTDPTFNHPFKTYTKKEISNELTQNEKDDLIYYSIAAYLVKEYANIYSISVMSNFFGTTEFVPVYKKDNTGADAVDANGNKIITSYNKTNTPDAKLKSALEAFETAAKLIQENHKQASSNTKCTLNFDLCGIGEDELTKAIPELAKTYTNIPAYSRISKYKPVNPYYSGFTFKGWSTSPIGDKIWNWETDVVVKNTTLYAIWVLNENYIKIVIAKRNKNPSLKEDIYCTIDETNKLILFPIKTSEKSSDNRYFFDFDLPLYCTSDISDNERVLVRPADPDVPTDLGYGEDVVITDGDGQEKTYTFKFVSIAEDKCKMTFITDGGKMNPNVADANLQIDPTADISISFACSKTGYVSSNWKDVYGEVVTNAARKFTDSTNILTVNFTKANYTITYKDSGDVTFSGTHGSNHPTSFTYFSAVKLDNPTKAGYVFIGYYDNQNCTGKKIKYIYKYTYSQNITLYAKWMSAEDYAALTGNLTVDGVNIDLENSIFYSTIKFSDGEMWVISESGINAYSETGTKLRRMNVGGKVYIPLGLTFGDTTDGSESVLAAVRHRTKTDDKLLIYYTKDRGMTWCKALEIEDVDLMMSDTMLSQNVRDLQFYKTIIYEGKEYTIKTINKITCLVCIDGDDEYIVMTSNTTGVKATRNKIMEGLSITVDGKLYILFLNVGVILFESWDPITDDDGNIKLKENDSEDQNEEQPGPETEKKDGFSSTPVCGDDGKFQINSDVPGFPETSTRPAIKPNDDIDLSDPDMIRQVNEYNKNKYRYIKTFEKAGDSKDDIFEELWKWSWGISKAGVILSKNSYIIENMGKYRPSIAKDKRLIQFERRPNTVVKRFKTDKDVEEIRKVQMRMDNCEYYIGWTRVIYNKDEETILETIKITKDYLEEQGILDGSFEEVWFVKYTRSELVTKTMINAVGEEITVDVYNTPEIESSGIFQKYLRFGKIDSVKKNTPVGVIVKTEENKDEEQIAASNPSKVFLDSISKN